MPWKTCEDCSEDFFMNVETPSCPFCKFQIKTKNKSLRSELKTDLTDQAIKTDLTDQAITQANILDKFGEVMQTIGYVVMGINALGFVIALFTSQ